MIFFKNFSALKYYTSIRPGSKLGDPVVTDIRVLKYTQDGVIQYKLNFADDYQYLPRRSKDGHPNEEDKVDDLYTNPVPIKPSKYKHLQDLKIVIPKDFHPFYDNLIH